MELLIRVVLVVLPVAIASLGVASRDQSPMQTSAGAQEPEGLLCASVEQTPPLFTSPFAPLNIHHIWHL